eukprot:TRINITY_DN5541_c0_g1_i1.p1 TRINITY_DN5541_c0_g1~~TRINITY_DN5541_c0_g1_i1.p1  ORF type:complete len:552 (-),score=162.96 TRINITY_DN5541_c0_g1_i1:165-1820(-)
MENLHQIKENLREILGVEAARRCSDFQIQALLDSFESRPDCVEVVLQSLCEQSFEGAFGEEIVTDEGFVFLGDQDLESGSGSMGCGSSYDYRSSTEHSQATEPSAHSPSTMICDMCTNKFSLISRKKTCCECGNYFCSTCLPRESGRTRTCSRCRVLNKMPPHRGDLMKLRVKDLQHFLTRKRINIKSCVEKKDLVELVLQHSGISSPAEGSAGGVDRGNSRIPTTIPTSNSWEDSSIRVTDQVPLERSGNFPKSYVESSHRREWFQERFGKNSESSEQSETSDNFSETPVENIEVVGESTPVETINNEIEVERIHSPDDQEMEDVDEVISVVLEEVIAPDTPKEEVLNTDVEDFEMKQDANDANISKGDDVTLVEALAPEDNEESSEGAVGGEVDRSGACHLSDSKASSRLNVDLLGEQGAASSPNSPRRFANQGMVYLSEIETLDDLNELSTKQVKELLAMNRVNFKGCVEKDELLKIVERLWKQEQRNKSNIESMDDDSMCKICMDSPIDCVMLECGHMCTCTQCGKQMAECPICRQYVVRVVKTFKA